ncbi:hypothetical protein [Hymenobacter cellulosilyticus]|uniref:Uncharacterized protein n=1 Tax=Hymenobacter cellulosilyticus TaxID=2932248 RepID=A0A8T9Q664_9BACT|nr:hypothetical protein [Hymenobacter cellulosilyticus]UOQ71901.1 hypothetical protein MUN79_25450 [Hymenobacter cellulosilyticus]
MPDTVWALVEDATVFGSSKAAVRNVAATTARRDAHVPRHRPAQPSYHANYPSLF